MSIASLLGRFGFVLSLLLFFSMDMQAGKSPLFIENKGQWDKQVLFMARCDGYAAWVTQSGITFDYYRSVGNAVSKSKNIPHESLHNKKTLSEHHVIQMTWDKGLPPSDIVRSKQSRTWHNYYYGNDPGQWAEHVPLYGELLLRNVWSGIDIRLYFENNNLRYDFHTAPYAKPQSIVLKFNGTESLHITPSSALELGTRMGKVVHDGLMAFQYIDGKKTIVNGHFKKLSGQRVGITISEYHHDTPLIIDPYVYQTFVGGGADDLPFDMVILNNATLVTGTTQSTNFPTKAGYDNTFNLAKSEAYMTYMQEDGKDIVWSTYLGQNTVNTQQNYGSRLFIHNNEIYLVGVGGSASFPTTTGLYDNTNDGVTTPGEGDGFFAKFSAGGGLLFSTFIGGPNGVGYPFGLARANDGNFIISGLSPTAKRIPSTINGYLGGKWQQTAAPVLGHVFSAEHKKMVINRVVYILPMLQFSVMTILHFPVAGHIPIHQTEIVMWHYYHRMAHRLSIMLMFQAAGMILFMEWLLIKMIIFLLQAKHTAQIFPFPPAVLLLILRVQVRMDLL